MTEHAHGHHHHDAAGGRFRTALLLTIMILAVEVGGGALSHSLALLSDAGHVFTDLIALGIAWLATRRPVGGRMTAGRTATTAPAFSPP